MTAKKADKRFTYRTKQVVDPERFEECRTVSLQVADPQREAFRAVFGEQVGLRFLDLIDKAISTSLENGADAVVDDDDGSTRKTFIGMAEGYSSKARSRFLWMLDNHPDLNEEWLGQLCLEFYRLGLNIGSHNELTKYDQPISKGFDTKLKEQARGRKKGEAYHEKRELCRCMAQQKWELEPNCSLEAMALDIAGSIAAGDSISDRTVRRYIRDLNPNKRANKET